MRDRLQLLDSIHLAFSRPEFAPNPDGTTHCNQFVTEVAAGCGVKGLEGLMANEIIDLVSQSNQWSACPIDKAQDLANEGTLILACLKADPHGHVNVICPGKIKTSGRWGNVPTVANVGKENFIGKGLSWAFSNMPTLYAWRPSL